MNRPELMPAILFVCGVIMVLGGVPIAGLGAMEVGPEVMLRSTGKRVVATVTDSRTMQSRRTGKSYQVRYRFKHKGKTYTHSDATGRTNLWTSLPEQQWRTAVKKRKVPVVMLPDAPDHSRLVAAPFPLGDKLAGLGLGLTLVLFGLLAGVKAIWDLVKR
mgnify:CR=1 FL=1